MSRCALALPVKAAEGGVRSVVLAQRNHVKQINAMKEGLPGGRLKA
jgi:hypothetical protein